MKNSVAFFDKISKRSKGTSKLGDVARRTIDNTKEYLTHDQAVLDFWRTEPLSDNVPTP